MTEYGQREARTRRDLKVAEPRVAELEARISELADTHDEMVTRRVVTSSEIVEQRAKGWSDWHPEYYCHRCGHPNLCWYTPNDVWNSVMPPDGIGPWNGILCPPCFAELAGGWPGDSDNGVCFALIPSRRHEDSEARLSQARAAIIAAVDARSGEAWREAWSNLTALALEARALVDEPPEEPT